MHTHIGTQQNTSPCWGLNIFPVLLWTHLATRLGSSEAVVLPVTEAIGANFVQWALRYLMLMEGSCPDDRGAFDHIRLGAQALLLVSHQSCYRTA